jgi:Glycosyl transferase family 2
VTATAPDPIRELARLHAPARAARDWPEADRLRAEIEAAGWRVVDHGTRFELRPATAPDVVDATGRVRYGSSASVPSLLAEPNGALATVILRATDDPAGLARALDSLRGHAPTGTQVVVVADGPDEETTDALDATDGPTTEPIAGTPPEVVWTADRLGPAAAANAGLRRAIGAVVVLLDPDVEETGDALTPLIRALDDPGVAIVGPWGFLSVDVRHWVDAPPGEVDAIDLTAMAFRRADAVTRGPFDERLRTERYLGTWWSLVLRDEGEGAVPRRAVALADLPLVRAFRGGDAVADAAAHESAVDSAARDRARLERRDAYRLLDQFGRRPDLLVAGSARRRPAEA